MNDGKASRPSEPTPVSHSHLDAERSHIRYSVFDELIEGVQVIDYEWRYLYLNPAAIKHGKLDAVSYSGRKISDLYPGICDTEVFDHMATCMKGRKPHTMVNRFSYPNGENAWFELRMNPVPDGILVFSVDITARVEAIEQARQAKEDLATTLDCMVVSVFSCDIKGHVTRINPAAELLTNRPSDQAIGIPLNKLVRFIVGEDEVVDPLERVLRNGGQKWMASRAEVENADGVSLAVACSAAPIRYADNSIRGVVISVRDMSEERRLSELLKQADRLSSIGRLAGGVAHDFNNLLTVIQGYSELLLAKKLPAEHEECVEQINQASIRASALTRQLLAFSRKQVLSPKVVDLNLVVENFSKLVQRLIGEDIHFSTKLKPDLGTVWFDPNQLEQVIMNLVVNARDAMPQGGRLTIETANVELSSEYAAMHPGSMTGPHVMLAVTDTGCGISHEIQSRVFEPFFTTKIAGSGTGLGLATVYGIVKQSGGNIWLYSEPNKGTTIKVYIPWHEQDQRQILIEEPKHVIPDNVNATILLVEDEESVRTLVSRVLRSAGYHVFDFDNADDAVKLFTNHHSPVHMLLTDVVLPCSSGRSLADQLIALDPDLMVVFMSGYTDDAIVRHGILDEGTRFIEKPITPRALLEKIRGFLKPKSNASNLSMDIR